jgi:hypothetical protein
VVAEHELKKKYEAFRVEQGSRPKGLSAKKWETQRRHKHGLKRGEVCQLVNSFPGIPHGQDVVIKVKPELDIALLHFREFDPGLPQYPVFGAGSPPQGRYVCRLGFPFSEFTNYEYDAESDELRWTAKGNRNAPRFPIEGMVTRHLRTSPKAVIGFEVSTPGLRGQSGGPCFDVEGRILGMQVRTAHLDLDFDVDIEVKRNGRPRRVQDHAFLHVGHCVGVDMLCNFMTDNGVSYQQA